MADAGSSSVKKRMFVSNIFLSPLTHTHTPTAKQNPVHKSDDDDDDDLQVIEQRSAKNTIPLNAMQMEHAYQTTPPNPQVPLFPSIPPGS